MCQNELNRLIEDENKIIPRYPWELLLIYMYVSMLYARICWWWSKMLSYSILHNSIDVPVQTYFAAKLHWTWAGPFVVMGSNQSSHSFTKKRQNNENTNTIDLHRTHKSSGAGFSPFLILDNRNEMKEGGCRNETNIQNRVHTYITQVSKYYILEF